MLLFLLTRIAPAPAIDLAYADTTIRIAADRAWAVYPGDCVKPSWGQEGVQALYANDYGRSDRDAMESCPAANANSPVIEVTAQNGIYRRLTLEIKRLPIKRFLISLLLQAPLGSATRLSPDRQPLIDEDGG